MSASRRAKFHWFAAGADTSACGLWWRDFEVIEDDGSGQRCRLCEQRRGLGKEAAK